MTGRREIVIRLLVHDRRGVSLGRTIVDFSRAVTETAAALSAQGVVVERSDVRGAELDPRPTAPPAPPAWRDPAERLDTRRP